MPLQVKEFINQPSGEASPLLHGSDVPDGIKQISVVVREWRYAPEGFNSPVIADLESPVYGAKSWAVNKTNLTRICSLVQSTELPEPLTVVLVVTNGRNPKTNEDVRTLAVSSVSGQPPRAKRGK